MGSLPNGTHFDPDNAMSSFDIFADFPYVDEAMFAQNQQTAAPVSQELSFPTSFTDEAFDAGNLDMLNTPFPQASEMSSFGAMDANFFCNTSASSYTPQQNLGMNRFMRNDSWNGQLSHPFTNDDLISTQPISSTPTSHKRPLECMTQDLPQPKRQALSDYQTLSPFTTASTVPSTTAADSIWTPGTSLSQSEVGLADDAADMCATWFSKYNVFPSEQHIAALSLLTRESPSAIQQWFGQILKQGMAGSHDSGYKSQSTFGQVAQSNGNTTDSQTSQGAQSSCNHETAQTSKQPQTTRKGKKGCTPTDNLDLLSRDNTKIYQCTRKCGKRYGRKCDWKRSEEEGYPSKSWQCSLCREQGIGRVKPCYRRYHFKQHFTNIHPGLNCADYEVDSVVHSETEFPRRCGFCTHTFSSRQERIDHIAEHFQKGSYMLQWNDHDDEGGDQDDGADDDDRPDSDRFDGGSPSSGGSSKNNQNQSGSNRPSGGSGGNSGNSGGNSSGSKHGGNSYYSTGQQYTLSDASPLQESQNLNGKNHSSLQGKNHASLEGQNHTSLEDKSQSSQESAPKTLDDRTVVDLDLIDQIVSQLLEAPRRPTPPVDDLTLCQGIQEPEAAALATLDQRTLPQTTSTEKQSTFDTTITPPDILQPPSPPADRSKPAGGQTRETVSEDFAQILTQQFRGFLFKRRLAELQKGSDIVDQARASAKPPPIPNPERVSVALADTGSSHNLMSRTLAERLDHDAITAGRYHRRTRAVGRNGKSQDATQCSKEDSPQYSCTFCDKSLPQIKSEWKRHETDFHETGQQQPTSEPVLSTRTFCEPTWTDIPRRSTPHSSSVLIGGHEDISNTPGSLQDQKQGNPTRRPCNQCTWAKVECSKDEVCNRCRNMGVDCKYSPERIRKRKSEERIAIVGITKMPAFYQGDDSNEAFWRLLNTCQDVLSWSLCRVDSQKFTRSEQDPGLTSSGGFPDGLHLVVGKPGSGKSQLMKYLSQRDQSSEYVRQWTGEKNRQRIALETAYEALEMAGLVPSSMSTASIAPPDLAAHYVGALHGLENGSTLVQPSSYQVSAKPGALQDLGTTHFAKQLQTRDNGSQDPWSWILDWTGGSSDSLPLKKFRSLKLLGSGGFSTVDEVLHRHTNLRISRKTLKSRSASNMAELQKEVNVLRKLRHPHIIRFLDSYTQGNKVSILLSPVADSTLAAWLDKCSVENSPGIEEKIVKMYGCLASSIRYLHQQRPVIKHMDIKPQNILVTHTDSNFPQVILCDFGISEVSEDATEDCHSAPLTRQYCAPETASSQTRGAKADIWSLGCVFLEMVVFAVLIPRNDKYRKFRKEFSSCDGRAYWQDISGLHAWLSTFQEKTNSLEEKCALRTIQTMLSPDPNDRPEAATLTILFTPAPCCLQFSGQETSFPGPEEERSMVEMLVSREIFDCGSELHVGVSGTDSYSVPEVPVWKEERNQSHVFHSPKGWLDECLTSHTFCRASSLNSKSKTLPTRLLEVLHNQKESEPLLRLVATTTLKSVEYAALSLSWSLDRPQCILTTKNIGTLQEGGLCKDALPQPLKDALDACLRLGIRYLWTDSLCIIQDSAEDRKTECLAMASIYRNALLTIMMLDGDRHGPPSTPTHSATTNVSSAKEYSIDMSSDKITSTEPPLSSHSHDIWDTRLWTLQERLLSKRLLYVTPHQLYWDCHGLKASDTFPKGLPSLVWEKVHSRPLEAPRNRNLGMGLFSGTFGKKGMITDGKSGEDTAPFWALSSLSQRVVVETDKDIFGAAKFDRLLANSGRGGGEGFMDEGEDMLRFGMGDVEMREPE